MSWHFSTETIIPIFSKSIVLVSFEFIYCIFLFILLLLFTFSPFFKIYFRFYLDPLQTSSNLCGDFLNQFQFSWVFPFLRQWFFLHLFLSTIFHLFFFVLVVVAMFAVVALVLYRELPQNGVRFNRNEKRKKGHLHDKNSVTNESNQQ